MNKQLVWLVEDDPAIVDIYRTVLEKAGFAVEIKSLGQEVISALRNIQENQSQKPQVLLLDLILPDINGMDILQDIRRNTATQDLKVFILTNQEEDLAKEGRETKVKPDKFLIKANTTPTQLVEIIKQALA